MATPRPTTFVPAVPGGKAPLVGGRAQQGEASASAPRAVRKLSLAGKEVRALVASAIHQRKRLLSTGRGHIRYAALIGPLSFLEAWLTRTNDHASQGALRDFWRMHENNVRMVMPGTKGGARTLVKLQQLCTNTH